MKYGKTKYHLLCCPLPSFIFCLVLTVLLSVAWHFLLQLASLSSLKQDVDQFVLLNHVIWKKDQIVKYVVFTVQIIKKSLYCNIDSLKHHQHTLYLTPYPWAFLFLQQQLRAVDQLVQPLFLVCKLIEFCGQTCTDWKYILNLSFNHLPLILLHNLSSFFLIFWDILFYPHFEEIRIKKRSCNVQTTQYFCNKNTSLPLWKLNKETCFCVCFGPA